MNISTQFCKFYIFIAFPSPLFFDIFYFLTTIKQYFIYSYLISQQYYNLNITNLIRNIFIILKN
jgi:hypothetical protein